MNSSAQNQDYKDYLLPLVVGVSGHRDLRPESIPQLEHEVRNVLRHLKQQYPHTPIVILSALAEGADRLVADVAMREISARLVAPIPMPRELYEQDFKSPESRKEFDRLVNDAAQSFDLRLPDGISENEIAHAGSKRDLLYSRVGEFIARHAQILIALWDGKPGRTGGTAEVVHHQLTGDAADSAPEGLDEFSQRGPVFQIVAPREKSDSAPLRVARRDIYPASDEYNESEAREFYHHEIFGPLETFNRNAVKFFESHHSAIAESAAELLPDSKLNARELGPARAGLDQIRRHYAIADSMARHFRDRTRRILKALTVFVLLGAICLDISHLISSPSERLGAGALTLLFSVFIMLAVGLFHLAKRRDYQNHFQDYRALAEGLRVQFFWRLAGIDAVVSDHYLGRHRWELDWIRNACRSSVVACRDFGGSCAAPELVDQYWIHAQHKYFKEASEHQEARARRNERWITIFFWLGVLLAIVLGLAYIIDAYGPAPVLEPIVSEDQLLHAGLILLITFSAVLAALLHNYMDKLALVSQVRLYRRMERIFSRHRQHVGGAEPSAHREHFLRLGMEALTENGDWVLTHRERPLEVPHH